MYVRLYKAKIKGRKKTIYISASDEKSAFNKLRYAVTHMRFEPLEVKDMAYLELVTERMIL